MAGALSTVLSGSLIYAMLGLVATMFGIAGLYVYLNAPFLAMMQILNICRCHNNPYRICYYARRPLLQEAEGVGYCG